MIGPSRKQIKIIVLSSCGYRCERCGIKLHPYRKTKDAERAIFHHIQHRCEGGSNSPENLMATCKKCEKKSHRQNGTQLRDQLSEKWPSSRLSGYITEILADSRKVYYNEHDD